MAQHLTMITRGKLNPTTRELCYLAGVLDSDGCISISKMNPGKQRTKNPRYVLTVNVVNTSMDLMHWLVEKFGGRFKPRPIRGINHKIQYDWWFNNGKAAQLLKLVEPYLIVKKEQAHLGINLIYNWVYPKGGRGARTPQNEVKRREKSYLTMKSLNQVGNTAATTESLGSRMVPGMMRQSELMGNHKREVEALPRH